MSDQRWEWNKLINPTLPLYYFVFLIVFVMVDFIFVIKYDKYPEDWI